jgi:arginyl-tRNA synthetase
VFCFFFQVVHYSFVLLQEGKMSTRKGNVVLLSDFMQEALDKAK